MKTSEPAGQSGTTPASDPSRTLTLIHLALPALLLVSLIDLHVLGGTVLDWLTPILFWLWLLVTPFVGGAALFASKRRAGIGRAIFNSVLLSVWALGLLGALLLH